MTESDAVDPQALAKFAGVLLREVMDLKLDQIAILKALEQEGS